MARLQAILRCLLLAAAAFALAALGGLVLWLYPTAKRIDAASAALLTCKWQDRAGEWHGNSACLESQALSITGSIRKASGEIAKAMPELTASAKRTASDAADEGQHIIAATQALLPVIEETKRTVGSLHDLVGDTDHSLNGENGTLAILNVELPKLGAIADGLANGVLPAATETIRQADKILADPEIPRAIGALADASRHADTTMEHVEGAAKETEQALGYIRDALKPTKLSFWQNVLHAATATIPGALVDFFMHWYSQRVKVTNP